MSTNDVVPMITKIKALFLFVKWYWPIGSFDFIGGIEWQRSSLSLLTLDAGGRKGLSDKAGN